MIPNPPSLFYFFIPQNPTNAGLKGSYETVEARVPSTKVQMLGTADKLRDRNKRDATDATGLHHSKRLKENDFLEQELEKIIPRHGPILLWQNSHRGGRN
jgi:hypothetical protein